MEILYDQVADNWSRNEARKGQEVGDSVDVFVGGKEGGERRRSVEWISDEYTGE